jgi:hypothetical protein
MSVIEKYQKNQEEEVRENLSSSTTTIDTEPGVCITPEDLERIRVRYEQMVGVGLTYFAANVIESAFKAGICPEAVLMAIDSTGAARSPSAQYLRAILSRWARSGIHTVDDVLRDQGAHDGAKAKWWEQKNPALNYAQRDYTGFDWNSVITDLSEFE